MKKVLLDNSYPRIYANNGQHAEYIVGLNLSGVVKYADNKAYTQGGDVGGLQVKSYHATVCKGRDVRAHVAQDKATSYGYVTKDCSTLYIMTPEEWVSFVDEFSALDHDSTGARNCKTGLSMAGKYRSGLGGSNGGGEKLRLKRCEPKMIEWCEARL